jgi:hypothetical protein
MRWKKKKKMEEGKRTLLSFLPIYLIFNFIYFSIIDFRSSIYLNMLFLTAAAALFSI